MGGIRIRKSIHIEQPDVLVEALVQSLGYASARRNVLMEHVTRGLQRRTWFTTNKITEPHFEPPPGLIRRSEDNGKIWNVTEEWASYRPREEKTGKEEYFLYSPNFFPNPRTDQVVRVYTQVESVRGLFPWDAGNPWFQTGRIYSQYSGDGGFSWSSPKQLVTRGGDAVHWAPGIAYGVNGANIEGVNPVPLGGDRFLLPSWSRRMGETKPIWHSAAFIGTWTGDGDSIEWDMTAVCTVDKRWSNNGGDEPSLVLLPDGRLLMTMRVRTDPGDGTILSSGKFWTVSADLGKTWAEPEPLRYTDGSQVLCPANLANIFLSLKTGKLYIVTNILDRPTYGCRPRFTLQIAEMDMGSFRVLKNTVTVIDANDTAGGREPTTDFSNFRWYEDRETKDIVLVMTGCPGDKGRSETCGVPPHSFRYDIALS